MKTKDGETVYLDSAFEDIYSMSQLEMAKMSRFSPTGHKYFDKTKPYWEIFKARFEKLGGFTSEISKEIR
jgi:hypothetical protein